MQNAAVQKLKKLILEAKKELTPEQQQDWGINMMQGYLHKFLHQQDSALYFFQKGLKIEDPWRKYEANIAMSETKADENKYEEAWALQKEAIKLKNEIDSIDNKSEAEKMKAATEMKERVQKLLGPAADSVWMSTFHALCVRILRRDAEKIGYSNNFSIADSAEQLTLIKRIEKDLNINPKMYDPKAILGAISNGKNDLLTPKDFKDQAASPFEKVTAQVYSEYQKDAVELSKELKNLDIAYLDPPYNQHPYGSNYFMLNLIIKNKLDVEISKVSGITQDWNHSVFNKPSSALKSMEEIIASLSSKFVIISYNSEGFITFDEMSEMLKKYGKLKTVEITYNTFRGSRNLQNRDIHVSEYLFILEK